MRRDLEPRPGDRVTAGQQSLITMPADAWRYALELVVSEKSGLPVRFSHYESGSKRMFFAVLSEKPMSQPAPKPHFVRGLD